MLFNLYSVVNILIAIDSVLVLHYSLNRHLIISKDRFKIDNTDYSNMLSPGNLRILFLFAETEDRNLNCSRILSGMTDDPDNSPDLEKRCRVCIENRHKATLCRDYKRIYNQINKLKVFLETMNIATILSPENKMEITAKGWTLRMFENTRLHLHK